MDTIFRWAQLFMATTLLVINLGVIALTQNQTSLNTFCPSSIFFEYSQVMIIAGLSSYLLLIVQLFITPNFPLLFDFLALYNLG